MEYKDTSIPKWTLIPGLLTAGGLIGYFLIMKALNLIEIMELRYLNILILFTGIILTLNYLRLKTKGEFSYLEGLAVGFFTTLISVGVFGVFIYIYLAYLDPEFFRYIQTHAWFGEYLGPLTTTIVVLLEGISSGAIITFITMMYFKRETKTKLPDKELFGEGNNK